MVSENETWLIDVGDTVIAKKTELGLSSLTDIERAIYCFWVADYSIRNSGTLGAMEDLYSDALSELNQFARKSACSQLSRISDFNETIGEEEFCENYCRLFESACTEIRELHERT